MGFGFICMHAYLGMGWWLLFPFICDMVNTLSYMSFPLKGIGSYMKFHSFIDSDNLFKLYSLNSQSVSLNYDRQDMWYYLSAG